MSTVVFLIVFFVVATGGAYYLVHKKKIMNWEQFAHAGTYMQGLAAIVLVIVGVVKGDDIIDKIKDLKESLDTVRTMVKETKDAIKTFYVSPPPPPEQSLPSESKTPEEKTVGLKKYWDLQLAQFPDKAVSGSLLYIPNKQELVEKLSSPFAMSLKPEVIAATLKNYLKTNPSEMSANAEVSTHVVPINNGGYKIEVNKIGDSSLQKSLMQNTNGSH